MEEHAFNNLKISDYSFLSALNTRSKCKKCGKSRMYYCYTCFLPLESLEALLPNVELPIQLDIIKHPGEVCGKSTAIHAAILASSQVCIHIYPNIPHYDPEKTILIYPDNTALSLKDFLHSRTFTNPIQNDLDIQNNIKNELFTENLAQNDLNTTNANKNCLYSANTIKNNLYTENNIQNDLHPVNDHQIDLFTAKSMQNIHTVQLNEKNALLRIEKAVFIDSTWLQVYKISTDPQLNGIPRIKLDAYDTKFWRYQRNKPSTYLSTIEAIYYFVREFHGILDPGPYESQYDDLLFFFAFFYEKICNDAKLKGKTLKSFDQRNQYKHKLAE